MNKNNTLDYFFAVKIFQQDTVVNQDLPINQPEVQQGDTGISNRIQTIDFSAIDSILRKSEERELQIQQEAERQAAILRWRQRKIDTTELLYKQFGFAGFPLQKGLNTDESSQNFLYSIPSIKPEEKGVEQSVFLEEGQSKSNLSSQSQKRAEREIIPKYLTNNIQFDWITILLTVSFLLLGWVRLFNKKYLVSLVKSVISYQEANALYREKNSLMERASFVVNLLFLSNISVFVVQLKYFWQLNINGLDDIILYAIVLASLLALYVFRAFSSWFIGYVFLKQKVFSEYFHNVNIFTKNTGLFLFPVIIALQFLSAQYIPVIVYTGIVIIAVLYLLQVVRSFQIIIRKNVSIYYMILYLCAFEIAPFLIVYKVLVSVA